LQQPLHFSPWLLQHLQPAACLPAISALAACPAHHCHLTTARRCCFCCCICCRQITIAFINAKRSKICGACGSLLDAVCLQKA
jgi:hypothetical protein